MMPTLRAACVLFLALGCGDPPPAPDASDSASESDGGQRADAGGGADARVPGLDGGSADGGLADGAVVDGSAADGSVADGGVADAGAADGGAADGGASDGGATDAGPAGPIPCATAADCGTASCIIGVCMTQTTSTESGTGLMGVDRMIAATDADGTLRLLTDIGGQTYDVVGAPGAFVATMGFVATDMYPLNEIGREQTSVAHASFTNGTYRWVILDQTAAVNEYRVIVFEDAAYDAAGTPYVLTTPRYPESIGTGSRYPLRLWSPSPTGWSVEEITRNVGFYTNLQLRVDASGQPEIVGTDAFHVYRWRLEITGWQRTVILDLTASQIASTRSPWLNDDAGHTHLVQPFYMAPEILYAEIDDTGVIRQVTVPAVSAEERVFRSSLSVDAAGNVYFLGWTAGTSPGRNVAHLHRVAPDGTTRRSIVASLRSDWSQWAELAVRPNGDAYVFLFAPAHPTEVIALRPL